MTLSRPNPKLRPLVLVLLQVLLLPLLLAVNSTAQLTTRFAISTLAPVPVNSGLQPSAVFDSTSDRLFVAALAPAPGGKYRPTLFNCTGAFTSCTFRNLTTSAVTGPATPPIALVDTLSPAGPVVITVLNADATTPPLGGPQIFRCTAKSGSCNQTSLGAWLPGYRFRGDQMGAVIDRTSAQLIVALVGQEVTTAAAEVPLLMACSLDVATCSAPVNLEAVVGLNTDVERPVGAAMDEAHGRVLVALVGRELAIRAFTVQLIACDVSGDSYSRRIIASSVDRSRATFSQPIVDAGTDVVFLAYVLEVQTLARCSLTDLTAPCTSVVLEATRSPELLAYSLAAEPLGVGLRLVGQTASTGSAAMYSCFKDLSRCTVLTALAAAGAPSVDGALTPSAAIDASRGRALLAVTNKAAANVLDVYAIELVPQCAQAGHAIGSSGACEPCALGVGAVLGFCAECPRGTFGTLDAGGLSTCSECPANFYCPRVQLLEPVSCPGGTEAASTGTAMLSDCQPCSAGTSRELYSTSGCLPCPSPELCAWTALPGPLPSVTPSLRVKAAPIVKSEQDYADTAPVTLALIVGCVLWAAVTAAVIGTIMFLVFRRGVDLTHLAIYDVLVPRTDLDPETKLLQRRKSLAGAVAQLLIVLACVVVLALSAVQFRYDNATISTGLGLGRRFSSPLVGDRSAESTKFVLRLTVTLAGVHSRNTSRSFCLAEPEQEGSTTCAPGTRASSVSPSPFVASRTSKTSLECFALSASNCRVVWTCLSDCAMEERAVADIYVDSAGDVIAGVTRIDLLVEIAPPGASFGEPDYSAFAFAYWAANSTDALMFSAAPECDFAAGCDPARVALSVLVIERATDNLASGKVAIGYTFADPQFLGGDVLNANVSQLLLSDSISSIFPAIRLALQVGNVHELRRVEPRLSFIDFGVSLGGSFNLTLSAGSTLLIVFEMLRRRFSCLL